MAVASDNGVCTVIGASVLEKGGCAVDACIATLLCLGAVQPQSNGIGGSVITLRAKWTANRYLILFDSQNTV